MVEDIKGAIRSRKSKDMQCQRKRDKGTNNDIQNITKKTNDSATRTSQKPVANSGVPSMIGKHATSTNLQFHNLF